MIVSLFVVSGALAGSSTIMIGQGATKDEAVQDAIRKAVESATGVFVYSTSEVKDFTLVKDQIVTASRGYVKDFNVMQESKNEGIVFVKLNVTVDTDNIKATIKRSIETITYEDALKDYASIVSRVERNKKYAEILKSISSRPLNELYQVDFAGYEIIDAGTKSADAVLTIRIAQNRFLWDTYYKALKQVGKVQKEDDFFDENNGTVIDYHENKNCVKYRSHDLSKKTLSASYCNGTDKIIGHRIIFHEDFNPYIIKPSSVTIIYMIADRKYPQNPITLYDKYIGNYGRRLKITNKGDKVYEPRRSPTVCTETEREKTQCGYYLGNDGFEYKFRHTFNNIEDIKKLPSIKATLKEI